MTSSTSSHQDNATLGIMLVIGSMVLMSINDVLIKQLSGGYPLHQIVFTRSAIGLALCLGLVWFEGGFGILRTITPGLHFLRGMLIVVANMTFFTAIAALPLADVTALFFVSPLFITLMSIPLLGEKVGARRIGAVAVGFLGVLVMLQPGSSLHASAPTWVLTLPVIAALAYASTQILTRKLGISTRASALAVYIQATFLLISSLFWLIAGDGRFARQVENESLVFLLRAWIWPPVNDLLLLVLLGFVSAGIAYTISQAYRSAAAATIAPFEYVALPLAIFWGWLFWGELPGPVTALGIALIAGSGIYVFVRERQRGRTIAAARPTRRW